MTFLTTALNVVDAQELTVSDIENTGCLENARGESVQQALPTIVLTKEGSVLSVQLINYTENCGTTDFNVTPTLSSGSNGGQCSLTVNVEPVIPQGYWCECPFNVSFTVHDLKSNVFYLKCWWYEGMVSLTEGEPLELNAYHPLLKTGKVWHEYAEDVTGNYHEEYVYYIDSQTVIDGETWFNVYVKTPVGDDNDFLPIGGSYYTRLQEKDGKIYENNCLLYDFNLNPGDYIINDDHIKVYATKRDNVIVNGHSFPRTTIRRDEYRDGFMYGSWTTYWVEGVGGSDGLIFGGGTEWAGFSSTNRGVIACYEDGNCFFKEENFYEPVSFPDNKCATPTIAYDKGKLVFSCETPGAECVYEIKCTDNDSGRGGEVSLSRTYEIRVHATLDGWYDSDVAVATISWRNGRPVMEGFSSITLDDDGNCDVNGDGTVDVAEIAKIIDSMAK